MYEYILAVITSFVLAIIFTPIVKKVALKLNVVDHPDHNRKLHRGPTALLGGVALYVTIVVVFLLFSALFPHIGILESSGVAVLLFGGGILMLGGFLDDKYQLTPLQQLVFPVIACMIALSSNQTIQFITHPLGGVIDIPVSLGLVFTFVWLMLTMYTTKILDGLDGLVSGLTVIAGILIFIVSLFWDQPNSVTSYLTLIVAGTAFGFLLFNWHPAKIFLGEGGSLFAGYCIGILSIMSGSKIATTLLIMGLPMLDMFFVMFRRLKEGDPIMKGDRRHLHYRLQDLGVPYQTTVFVYFLAAIAFSLPALFFETKGKLIALVLLVTTVVVGISCLITLQNKRNGQTKI